MTVILWNMLLNHLKKKSLHNDKYICPSVMGKFRCQQAILRCHRIHDEAMSDMDQLPRKGASDC